MRFYGLGLIEEGRRSIEGSDALARDTTAFQSAFLRGLPLPTGHAVLTNPYAQHGTIYACVRTIYVTFSQAPMRFWRGEKEVQDAPILRRLRFPSPLLASLRELWEYTVMFLELTGNALWWLDNDGQRAMIPRNILVFHPNFFEVVRDKRTGMLAGYRFKPATSREPLFLTPDEVVHFRYPNPDDPLWGLGPLQVARVEAEQDFKATQFNSAFFDNAAEPAGLLIYKGKVPLTQDQKQQVIESWNEQHRGVQRAFKLGVLPGEDWGYQQLGLTHQDMAFIEQRKLHRHDIATIFNVPLIFLNDFETSGLSDAGLRTQTRLFWDTNLIPKGRMLQDHFNSDFLSRYDPNLMGLFDYDQVPALQQDYSERLDQAQKLTSIGYPLNMVNEKLDLGMDPVPWGDEYYVPISLVPISSLGSGERETEEDKDEEERLRSADLPSRSLLASKSDAYERHLDRFWRSVVHTFAPLERRYQNRLTRHFFTLRARILEALPQLLDARSLSRADENDIALILFDERQAAIEIQALSRPFFEQAFALGGHMVLGEISSNAVFVLDTQTARRFLEHKLIRVVGINRTIREQLRHTILLGLHESESLVSLADRVRETFNVAASRARTIARTEIGQALSGGRFEAMEQQRIAQHMWLSSRDSHVREAHAPRIGVDGEVRNVGQKFSNGLRFPLDPEANNPGEVINCRCVTVPIE
jgi:HK97 family phage portal protein